MLKQQNHAHPPSLGIIYISVWRLFPNLRWSSQVRILPEVGSEFDKPKLAKFKPQDLLLIRKFVRIVCRHTNKAWLFSFHSNFFLKAKDLLLIWEFGHQVLHCPSFCGQIFKWAEYLGVKFLFLLVQQILKVKHLGYFLPLLILPPKSQICADWITPTIEWVLSWLSGSDIYPDIRPFSRSDIRGSFPPDIRIRFKSLQGRWDPTEVRKTKHVGAFIWAQFQFRWSR